jgi:hypothetical protein
MTADRTSVTLRRYSEALDAAERALAETRAEHLRAIAVAERIRDAAVLLAEARCLRALDAERDAGMRMMRITAGCTHDHLEDAPAGVVGCCAQVAS